MPRVTVTYGQQGFEVSRIDNMPLSIFVGDCAKQLGLSRKWRDEFYVPGIGWLDVITDDCEVTLYRYFYVKVHFNGGKQKVRCSQGDTVDAIVTSIARIMRLPTNWKEHLTIDQGYAWTTVFNSDGEIHLKDPRIERR